MSTDNCGISLVSIDKDIFDCTDLGANTVTVNDVAVLTADAGADDNICRSEAVYAVTDASSSDGTVLWTTDGDGTFDNATVDSYHYILNLGNGSTPLSGAITIIR